MDFPIFHLDFMGNRLLIAVIAILHVVINHSLAVGLIPLVSFLEYVGYKQKNKEWDELARKVMFVAFVITTSLGAMTGVGIWFSASLVNPNSIASLIRVFFLAWFVEWIVFVTEVVLILIYFLTWKKSNRSEEEKKKHIKIGFGLATFSWITMAIIVAILSFMMDPGNWRTGSSLLTAFFNPVYIAQLAFRTPLAMVMGGCVTLFLILFFTKEEEPLRRKSIHLTSIWILAWFPWLVTGTIYYYFVIPDMMVKNMSVAIGTMEFESWYGSLMIVLWISSVVIFFIALWGFVSKPKIPSFVLVLPILFVITLMIFFERSREFVRKPYVIGNYMYSNTFRLEEYPLLQKEGILKFSTYAKHKEITEANQTQAGKEVFLLACSRCHTSNGINSVVQKFRDMYNSDEFNPVAMKGYIRGMHNARYFMPPFPGNEAEMDALISYIIAAKDYPNPAEGAQDIGTSLTE